MCAPPAPQLVHHKLVQKSRDNDARAQELAALKARLAVFQDLPPSQVSGSQMCTLGSSPRLGLPHRSRAFVMRARSWGQSSACGKCRSSWRPSPRACSEAWPTCDHAVGHATLDREKRRTRRAETREERRHTTPARDLELLRSQLLRRSRVRLCSE